MKSDGKYVEVAMGGGVAAEVYFLPLSAEKEYAKAWDLPFSLGGTTGVLPVYEGTPNAQEWLNMLNGEGF